MLYRAIGMPKSNIFKVAFYESLSYLSVAIFLGVLVGLISSGLIGTLFMSFTEMPFVLLVS